MAYQVWAFTQAGAKAAVLENAYDIKRTEKINTAPTLSFSIPVGDPKSDFVSTAYEIKIWNIVKGRFEGLFVLDDCTENWGSSGSVLECNYSGAMAQLTKEDNISYDTGATPLTPTAIVTALLAKQEFSPAITVGTIHPTTTFVVAVDNTNILKALLECVSYLGGYIEVDENRALNWYTEPTGSPTREIRYQKNMKAVTRKRDYTELVNKLYAYGCGETEAQLTLLDAGEAHEYIEDATSQTAYGVKIRRITDKRIIHPTTLLLWAQKVLTEYKNPVFSYTVDVVNLAVHPDYDFDLEDLEIGQIVRVVNSDLNDLNVNVKVCSVTTDLSDARNVSVELANVTKTLADSVAASADTSSVVNNIAVQIGAGQVTVMGTFTVDGWRTTGTTTIDGGNITANTLSCSAIKTSTLNAVTISLGTTGSNGVIKSSNFSAGSAGFQISGDGSAEFNNVTVRGTIAAATISSGNTVNVIGSLKSNNYVHNASGWKLFGDGICEFWVIDAGDSITCSDGGITGYELISHTVLLLDSNVDTLAAPKGSIFHTSSHLYFKDPSGGTHSLCTW
ncbi:MAG: phage tail spike protein [Dehalococcoidia bacterium]|jgi:phage minor structural protein